MTVFLLILSILVGFIWLAFPSREVQPFTNDIAIDLQWYVSMLCYKIRFILLVGALMINLKGTIRMIAMVFLIFYGINLMEYVIMYSSPYPLASLIVKSIVSLFLLTLWNYGKRNNTTAYS